MISIYWVVLCYVFFISISTVTTVIILQTKKNILNKANEISKDQPENQT